jgi:biotin operon repressor
MSRSSEAVKRWRHNTKLRMLIAMGGQCVCCGYHRCNDALEFHHLDSDEKDFAMGSIIANPKRWSRIVEELRKCVLLCAICHREVHAGFREIPENVAKFNEECCSYTSPLFSELIIPVISKSHSAKNRFDWESIDLAEELKTKSINAIAEKLGCSNAAVWKRAMKLGFWRRKPSIWEGHDLESLMSMMSMNKIARLVGCSEMAVRKRVRKLNLTHLIRYKNKEVRA